VKHVLTDSVAKVKSHQDLKQGEPLVVPTGNKFGELIACDPVGPLPETPDGHTFILTIMDAYSRYPTAVPIKAATAKEVAVDCLMDGWPCSESWRYYSLIEDLIS
jgi:hypothetical protein